MNNYHGGFYFRNRSNIRDFSTEELAEEIARREREEKKEKIREEIKKHAEKILENADDVVSVEKTRNHDGTGYEITFEIEE